MNKTVSLVNINNSYPVNSTPDSKFSMAKLFKIWPGYDIIFVVSVYYIDSVIKYPQDYKFKREVHVYGLQSTENQKCPGCRSRRSR